MNEATELRERVLSVLRRATRAKAPAQVADSLRLKQGERDGLGALLAELESQGLAARNPKGLWWLPERLGFFVGRIRFSSRSTTARLLDIEDNRVIALVRDRRAGNALNGDRVLAREFFTAPGRMMRRGWIPDGRVVRVLERAQSEVTGIVQAGRGGELWVEADDRGFVHRIRVRDAGGARPGVRVLTALDEWRTASEPLTGRIVEVLGMAGERGADREALLRRFGLRREFPSSVMDEAEGLSDEVDDGGREDLRDQLVVTIDPEDARDHDDAIHVEDVSGGGWRVWVHIADVSHYVGQGTALDAEAFARGTSVYLPWEVISMLPGRLSNDLCSLLPGVERPAVTVRFDVSCEGRVSGCEFFRSVIRVGRRLSYAEALGMLRAVCEPCVAGVEVMVREAGRAAQVLRKARFSDGALELDFPEAKVVLDEEGKAVRMELVEHDESHELIEELMVAANEAVAAALKEAQRGAVYRVHEAPDPDRLLEFREVLSVAGIEVGNLSAPGEVQRMLGLLKGREDEQRLKTAFLRSLRLAVYHPEPLGHYGLAKTNYTHFTSPIRRYPDLVAHRALGILKGWLVPGPIAPVELRAATEVCSARERNGAQAESEAVRLCEAEMGEKDEG